MKKYKFALLKETDELRKTDVCQVYDTDLFCQKQHKIRIQLEVISNSATV